MSESKTPRIGGETSRQSRILVRGDFIPLEEAYRKWSTDPWFRDVHNKIDACDLCLRVRLFTVKPDFICKGMIETKTRHCLAKFYKRAQRLD
jgi:hypothetical protein